jgi:hypothetical protein
MPVAGAGEASFHSWAADGLSGAHEGAPDCPLYRPAALGRSARPFAQVRVLSHFIADLGCIRETGPPHANLFRGGTGFRLFPGCSSGYVIARAESEPRKKRACPNCPGTRTVLLPKRVNETLAKGRELVRPVRTSSRCGSRPADARLRTGAGRTTPIGPSRRSVRSTSLPQRGVTSGEGPKGYCSNHWEGSIPLYIPAKFL